MLYEDMGTPLVDTLERSECRGYECRWAVLLNTNTNNKLASCSTPSFPEENVMHEHKYLNWLQVIVAL